MNADQFIQQRKAAWDELSAIVKQMESRGARGTGSERVQQMLALYRQASADLARLRTLAAEPSQVTTLNRLVTRAHAQIYRAGGRRDWSLTQFLWRTYPRLFRAQWRFMLASFILCAGVYAMAYQAVQEHPEIIADIMGGGDEEFTGPKEAPDIQDRFRTARQKMGSAAFSSAITTNNIRVALMAFALGVTFGAGTVYVLVVNSAMVGGIAGAFARSGNEAVLWSTLLPHGALELTAIVFAGGAGLMMGWALWVPGQRTRRRALQEEAVKAMIVAVGLIPAFIIAGIIEGFVTPRDDIPQALKVGIGVLAAVVYVAYLLIAGRSPRTDQPAAPLTSASAA